MDPLLLRRRAVPPAVIGLLLLAGCSAGGPSATGRVSTRQQAITAPVTVDRDGRTLTVQAESGGCDDLPRLVAAQHAATVTLTVRVTTRIRPGYACAAYARYGPARTVLRTALGSRPVTDGVTGRRLVVPRS